MIVLPLRVLRFPADSWLPGHSAAHEASRSALRHGEVVTDFDENHRCRHGVDAGDSLQQFPGPGIGLHGFDEITPVTPGRDSRSPFQSSVRGRVPRSSVIPYRRISNRPCSWSTSSVELYGTFLKSAAWAVVKYSSTASC